VKKLLVVLTFVVLFAPVFGRSATAQSQPVDTVSTTEPSGRELGTLRVNDRGPFVFFKTEALNRIAVKSTTNSDRDIHSALANSINLTGKTVYFLIGHGERGIEDPSQQGLTSLVSDLENMGFAAESLNLTVTGSVPEDSSVLVLADQQAPLQKSEIAAISEYLQRGGAALFARDAVSNEARVRVDADGLREYLSNDWGINIRPDFVVEPEFGVANQVIPIRFVSYSFGSSPITPSDAENLGMYFDIARSIGTNDSTIITFTALVLTSTSAWGETDFQTLPPLQDDVDTAGPLAVGVSAENRTTGSRIVVFGDADFLSNQYISIGGNNLVATNVINWLADSATEPAEWVPTDDGDPADELADEEAQIGPTASSDFSTTLEPAPITTVTAISTSEEALESPGVARVEGIDPANEVVNEEAQGTLELDETIGLPAGLERCGFMPLLLSAGLGALIFCGIGAVIYLIRWRRSDGNRLKAEANFCPHCGEKYPLAGKFCSKCGRSRQ
jgi:hypothetical protein